MAIMGAEEGPEGDSAGQFRELGEVEFHLAVSRGVTVLRNLTKSNG
jgi:hypothetical protein